MKKSTTLSRRQLKKILLQGAAQLQDGKEKDALTSSIHVVLSRKKVVIQDVCEACGQPTKNLEIHPHCEEWWV